MPSLLREARLISSPEKKISGEETGANAGAYFAGSGASGGAPGPGGAGGSNCRISCCC